MFKVAVVTVVLVVLLPGGITYQLRPITALRKDIQIINQTKPTHIQVMGVIYSMMQVECTTLPDTIVFNSKMNRPNKPEAKGNQKKQCGQTSMIGAISCETPSLLHWNITIPTYFPLS